MGVVVSSLLARTGAVRMTRHASAPASGITPAQTSASGKRRRVDGNGGGNGNGGSLDDEGTDGRRPPG